jgi:hypothetical protein
MVEVLCNPSLTKKSAISVSNLENSFQGHNEKIVEV